MKFPKIKLGLACLLLFSCSSAKLYDSNRASLDKAVESLSQKQYDQVIKVNDKLVGATAAEASQYRLQRFYASYLNTMAHLEASFSGAFFQGVKRSGASGIGARGKDVGASLAHMMASARASGYAIDWKPKKASQDDLDAQIPESLAKFGLENAEVSLILARMTIYARLGFDSKVIDILNDSPELRKVSTCKAMLERTNFPEAAHPWLMYMVFRHLRGGNDVSEAFRFAAETLFHDLGPNIDREIRDWITKGKDYKFVCTNTEEDTPHEADPTRAKCRHRVELKDFILTSR
jgi:hypothetical protein